MSAQFIGVHMPTGKGLAPALRTAAAMGCTALQVFTSSPRNWRSSLPDRDKIAEFRAASAETGLTQIISHDTYLVNLCHVEPALAAQSRSALRDEMERCHLLGIPIIVSHMGALRGRDFGEAFNAISEQTCSLLEEIPEGVTLCMENTSGQGSAVNSRFEELAILLELCGGHGQLGVCLDSCHLFASGYDIRTREAYEKTMSEFDRLIGFDKLKAIHLNDSKKGFNSRVDRHENIGKGEIGLEPFGFFIRDPRMEHIPMVVETPTENEGHKNDLAALVAMRDSN